MANKQMHHLKVGDNIFEIVDSVARSGISGAPSIVSLSSAMIDTSKLYLYIGSETGYTSGNWYYHNGTSWVSGGQYGDMQLDTSLTTSGMAADAKSVGDRFNNFATTATAGQAPIADGAGGWEWGTVIGGGGQPTPVTLASEMTDTEKLYLYLGNESGYANGYVYAYIGDAWTNAQIYGKGQNGADGADGTDGVDGYSPTASVTQTATGVNISVTDKNGTTSATVENGTATDEQVDAWLDEHPEATTTVQDGAITTNKIANGAVTEEKLDPNISFDSDLFDKTIDVDHWIDNKAIVSGTNISNYSNFSVAILKISHDYGNLYHVTTYGNGGRIATYDSLGNGLSNVQTSSGKLETLDITIPDSAEWMAVTCRTSNKPDMTVEIDEAPIGIINEIANYVSDDNLFKPYVIKDLEITYNQYVVGSDGRVISYNQSLVGATDFIEIPSPAKIVLQNYAKNGSYYSVGYALYSSDKKPIIYNPYNAQGGTIADPLEISIPANVRYIRFTVYQNDLGTIKPFITVRAIDTMTSVSDIRHKDYGMGFTDFYNSCVCIGDSVTAGQGSTASNYTYPNQLKTLTGWGTVDTYATSGYTAKQWYDNYFSLVDFTQYDIAIIELGLNGGLTGSLETDVDPYDDYTQYADTLLGNYCKIVAGAKSQKSDIHIVLIVSPNWDRAKAYVDVIYQIAEKYNASVINLIEAQECLQDNRFHSATDFLHFNNLGYYFKARAVYRLLNQVIGEKITSID